MTKGRSFELDAWVCGTYDDDETQTKIGLRYNPEQPWSVLLVTKLGIVTWVARDLLQQGLKYHVGGMREIPGEVAVRPDSNDTMVEIMVYANGSPNVNGPHLFIRVPRADLVFALGDMRRMVRPGKEQIDWDKAMVQCGAEAA